MTQSLIVIILINCWLLSKFRTKSIEWPDVFNTNVLAMVGAKFLHVTKCVKIHEYSVYSRFPQKQLPVSKFYEHRDVISK